MHARRVVELGVVAAACFAAGSQAFGSSPELSGARSGPSASAAASLVQRVRQLERRVNALALLEQRNLAVTANSTPLIPLPGTSFQNGSVGCLGPNEVPVAGGIGYPTTPPHASSVMIESAPTANGWEGAVSSPQGDDAHVYVVCAGFQ